MEVSWDGWSRTEGWTGMGGLSGGGIGAFFGHNAILEIRLSV